MTPETKEHELPTIYKVTPELVKDEWVGTYKVEIFLPIADSTKRKKITEMENVPASELYVKLGVKYPELKTDAEVGIKEALEILQTAVTATGSQTIISAEDHRNALLDAMNKIRKSL
jgi:hypothetical protein